MSDLNALNFDQLVPKTSKYLSKEDVGEDGVILTIAGFRLEAINTDDGEEDKVILHFEESDVKPMVVNRTNAQLLKQITGAQTAGEAKGRQIVVYNDPSVGFGGKIVGGLRIKKVPGAPKVVRPAAPPRGPAASRIAPQPAVLAGQGEEFQDDKDIPF
jgi:hypothetical protein